MAKVYAFPTVYTTRLVRETPKKHIAIEGMAQASSIFAEYLKDLPQEHFVVLMLDAKLRGIGIVTVHIGSTYACHIEAKAVFRPAILANAVSIIIAHNHPSGDPTPSPEDVDLTRTLVKAGKLLGIEVLDHVIVGDPETFSFMARNIMPEPKD